MSYQTTLYMDKTIIRDLEKIGKKVKVKTYKINNV
jgi:hypothetical protein